MRNTLGAMGGIAIACAALAHLAGVGEIVTSVGKMTVTIHPVGAGLIMGLCLVYSGLRRSARIATQITDSAGDTA